MLNESERTAGSRKEGEHIVARDTREAGDRKLIPLDGAAEMRNDRYV